VGVEADAAAVGETEAVVDVEESAKTDVASNDIDAGAAADAAAVAEVLAVKASRRDPDKFLPRSSWEP